MKDEMGRACSVHGREMRTKFRLEREKGGDRLEDLGLTGRIIIELILASSKGMD
jgi:hypothetical protein